MSKQGFIKLGFVLATAACQSGSSTSSPSPDDDLLPTEPTAEPAGWSPLSVGPERSAQLVNHAVLAFRQTGSALVGGYQTQEARVVDGAIELTPFTLVNGQRTAHAPMSLETLAISMDDGVFAGPAVKSRIDNGTIKIDRGDLVEESLQNLENGLHQEWKFASAPGLAGDLVVEISASGYHYTKATSEGLHFAAANDAIGFRYGNGIWISGDGTEWPITSTYENGRIRLTVPESVVALTVFPAVLDPVVTAEVAVDAPVAGFSGANAQHAAIAFDGTNYLVVWDDNRNSADSDIWGTRVSQAGAILDPLGIKIVAGTGKQQNPTVAFNGTQYVVAWEDFKVVSGTEADIAAATVSTGGAVAQLGAVAATGVNETEPHLAGGSGTALLVWNANGDIRGAVRSSGAFGATQNIAATAASEINPAVALNPAGNYLVAWSEGSPGANLRGQFVTQAGGLSGTVFDISAGAGTQQTPAATFDGTNFDVVWTNNNLGINIFGTRVSTAGVVLDTHTEGMATVGGVTITGAPENQQNPAIACDSASCLVIWQDRRNLATSGFDILGQRVSLASFALVGGEITITTAAFNQFSPAVVSNGGGFFGAWQDNRSGNEVTVFGAAITSAGAVGTNVPLVGGQTRESAPHVGVAGGTFGVFWSDSRTFGNDIRYVRFSGPGTKLDATALVAVSAANAQVAPSASTDLGANTLLVWSDTRNGKDNDIFAARVSLASGTTLDPAGIQLSVATNDQLVPDVASSGSVALAVWQDRRTGGFDILGALIDANGTVIASDIPISNAANDQTRPAVTFDSASGQFIVVWSDGRTSGSFQIFGTRVSTAGAVLDPAGVALTTAPSSRFSPAITSSTVGSFAAWEDRRAGQDIFGTRLTGGAALTVQDPGGIAVSQAAGGQTSPKITTLSGFYTVVWVDSRNVQTDIFGRQISTAGVLQGAEFGVATSPDNESNVTVTAGTTTQARVAYETARLDTRRVNTRIISATSAGGQACSGSGSCATGFCVDGFCCDQACGGNHVPSGPPGATVGGDCHSCAGKFTGQANGTCAPVVSGTICRNYESTFCDLREQCNGVALACPADVGRRGGLTCARSTNFPPGVGNGICQPSAAPGPHFCQ